MTSTSPDLVRRVTELAANPGPNRLPLPRLSAIRVQEPFRPKPVVYEACLCFVVQGSKHAHVGDQTFTYDASQYLVLSVPLPMECEIQSASAEVPYLALTLELDVGILADLVAEVDGDGPPQSGGHHLARGLYVTPMHDRLQDALGRLIDAVHDPVAARSIAGGIEREVLFHVLRGPQGDILRGACRRDDRQERVGRAIRFLHAHLAEPIDIGSIAEAAAMSPSTLHAHFKAVTADSPVAYLKKIRLHRARRLLVHEGVGASDAAYRVGYRSPSQFSREFKRLFGETPSEAANQGASSIQRREP